jgi:hypothetical protein
MSSNKRQSLHFPNEDILQIHLMESHQRQSQHWPPDGGHFSCLLRHSKLFSRAELEVFLRYVSPNHNVDGALTKMVEELLLVKTTNKVGTEIYYLGFRNRVSDVDTRQDKYIESITILSETGFRVINSRHNATRASTSKRQEPSASKEISVKPSAKKKAGTNPKQPLSSTNEESSKSLTGHPPKTTKSQPPSINHPVTTSLKNPKNLHPVQNKRSRQPAEQLVPLLS